MGNISKENKIDFSQKHVLSNKNGVKHLNILKLYGGGGGGGRGRGKNNTLLLVPKTNYPVNNHEKQV